MMRMCKVAALMCWFMVAESIPVLGGGLVELAIRFGVEVVGLGVFVYWSWVREQDLTSRLRKIEDANIETLKTTIAENTKAFNRFCDHCERIESDRPEREYRQKKE